MANADYLVDELCAQLRALDQHPAAPALFAAILRCSGAPPVLLPLLAEPARLAVRSLSITARYRASPMTLSCPPFRLFCLSTPSNLPSCCGKRGTWEMRRELPASC